MTGLSFWPPVKNCCHLTRQWKPLTENATLNYLHWWFPSLFSNCTWFQKHFRNTTSKWNMTVTCQIYATQSSIWNSNDTECSRAESQPSICLKGFPNITWCSNNCAITGRISLDGGLNINVWIMSTSSPLWITSHWFANVQSNYLQVVMLFFIGNTHVWLGSIENRRILKM